ncbi:hypothetical protein ACHQM5_016514 [Ranunculus cassubicifolius]
MAESTKGTWRRDILPMFAGSKLQLIWDDDKPVAPRKYPTMFAGSIGVIMAKARLYDWTKRWEEQTKENREHLWTELKKVWELDENKKEVTLDEIANAQFRDKKCKWKKNHFTPYTTYEERMNAKPEQLTAQEWNSLVQFWDTQAHIIEEEGAPPNLGDFNVRTCKSSRTNDIVDEASRAYIDQMRDIAGTDEDGNQQPITEEIYRQVMPPPRNRRTRRCFPPRVIASEGNRMYHVIELQNELAELKKKEEERQAEIDEIKRNSQEKDEERQREIDDMKRQFQKHCETMEERVMQKLLETVPMTHMLSAALSEPDISDNMTHWG